MVLRQLIPLEVSLAAESKFGALAPQVSSIAAAAGLRSRPLLGQHKMAIHVLKGRETFDTFSTQMRVYVKLHGFESVFANVEVGADSNDRESSMAQRVAENQL